MHNCLLVYVHILQELKPEEKRAKDRKLWEEWIEKYR